MKYVRFHNIKVLPNLRTPRHLTNCELLQVASSPLRLRMACFSCAASSHDSNNANSIIKNSRRAEQATLVTIANTAMGRVVLVLVNFQVLIYVKVGTLSIGIINQVHFFLHRTLEE